MREGTEFHISTRAGVPCLSPGRKRGVKRISMTMARVYTYIRSPSASRSAIMDSISRGRSGLSSPGRRRGARIRESARTAAAAAALSTRDILGDEAGAGFPR